MGDIAQVFAVHRCRTFGFPAHLITQLSGKHSADPLFWGQVLTNMDSVATSKGPEVRPVLYTLQ